MRTATLSFAFVACSYAANAQFSLLPQVGFENSKTIIRYNDLNSFSPLGVRFSPQASLRLNYASKQGHGFFLGVASSRSVVSFNVSNPENGMNNYAAATGNMQLRLEGGYQFSTPGINIGKSNNKSQATKKQVPTSANKTERTYSGRCGRNYSYSNRCSANRSSEKQQAEKSKGTSWIRIQPSIGMGFIPAIQTDVLTKTPGGQTSYEYRAGNWNTALITGANVEFGKNNKSLFTLSVNYFNGMGNLGKQTVSTVQNNKTTITTLQSDASGWNLRVGIPVSFIKNRAVKAKKSENAYKPEKTSCGQYRAIYRCRSL
jgi:hypothetical protein